ncbi:MmpS family transport accessory protein [Rhodococcus wratislaviensis]|uniref:Uncharacterized protein n=1 Tax=Rhodococcus wratislaviensis NBRC 100605 TaxID=1219028 RepID=X0PVB6_RHOWR|nr:MmpS family transport accessory protein [Rhodococcus wratislaviensis]GAF47199.1 hypothetical protein RW1_038_01210 [Rhodococcus wratislaviensis NBRC 100605]
MVCLIVAAALSIHEEMKRDRAAEASTRSVAAPAATTTVETGNGRPLMSPYTPPTTTMTTTFVETAAIYTPTSRPAAPPTSAYTRPPAPVTTIPPLVAKPVTKAGKSVTYEVISDSPVLNSVTWFDGMNELQQEYPTSAPWSLSVVNTATYPMMGLGAQTEGQSVTCRIIVDGRVMDQQTAVGQYAVVNCNA